MNGKMPRTPFSTALSGSARMTELRLRNIFSGPKKRPPALFLALMFAMCIFCGNLVSCNVAEAERVSQPGDVSLSEYNARAVTLTPGYQPRNEEEEWLLQALFQDADMLCSFQDPAARLLASIWEEDYILGAALVEDHLENTLVLGVMDRETRELTPSGVFARSCHGGVANVVTFQNYSGENCLLYTFNGQENGQYTGQAGVVCLDGPYMNWQWPVEGDVGLVNDRPDGPQGAFDEYEAYWNGHLALLAPGGVDIYSVNPEFVYGQEEPWSMWQPESGETFYADPSSAESLPMPIYFQALNWLCEHTNDPGGWRITSLRLDPAGSLSGLAVDCFALWACTDDGAQVLSADLFFSFEPLDASTRRYSNLESAELRPADIWPSVPLGNTITPECRLDQPFQWLTYMQAALVKDLDPANLPRQAAEDLSGAAWQDLWQGILLPMAYDQAQDVTLYGVMGQTSGGDPICDGVVLRCGNLASYFPLCWDGNLWHNRAPLLLVDDLDGDGKAEAAVSLLWGWGTGAWSEALYIFDLDTMTYTLPDYAQVPLEITVSPDGKTARLTSGDQSLDVDITKLAGYFDGWMEVGNVIQFQQKEGKLFCALDVDFTHNTLGYMAEALFPLVYENGAYQLGPAAMLQAIR